MPKNFFCYLKIKILTMKNEINVFFTLFCTKVFLDNLLAFFIDFNIRMVL